VEGVGRAGGKATTTVVGQYKHEESKYPKTIYVDELIGPETVNTMPVETFREFPCSRPRPSQPDGKLGGEH
jgi:transaldolase